jgi:hypothetical protein
LWKTTVGALVISLVFHLLSHEGFVMKYRATFVVALMAAFAVPASAAGVNALGVPDYSGNWWNSSQNGMGASIIEQNNIIFVLWFVYSAQGQPMFLQLGGPLRKNAQSQDALSGDLTITNGPQPMNFDPSKVTAKSVGSASIAFSDPYHATMTYQPGQGAPAPQTPLDEIVGRADDDR